MSCAVHADRGSEGRCTASPRGGDHRAQRDFLRLCESAESIERQRSLDAQREAADRLRKIGANDSPWYHKSSEELREEIQQEAEELGFHWRPREGRDPQ